MRVSGEFLLHKDCYSKDLPKAQTSGYSCLRMRVTLLEGSLVQQRKDAQDLGISIKLFPLSRQHEEVNISLFYAGQLHGLILLPMNLWRLKGRLFVRILVH